MLGTFTGRSRSVSRPTSFLGGRSGSSESLSEQRRPLLLPQELKELGTSRAIILLENTKPILAQKICYWRDPAFTSRLAAAPPVPAIDLACFTARIERRVRDLRAEDVDAQTPGLLNVPPACLEVLQAWDARDLPAHTGELSEEEALAYVERHFTLLGVPADRVRRTSRQVSLADPDVATPGPVTAGGIRADDAARSARRAFATSGQDDHGAARRPGPSRAVRTHGARP